MAFDPITYSAVVNSKSPIGSLERVVSSFNDPKFLSSNQVFDKNDYPILADRVSSQFQADIWQKNTIPTILSDSSVTNRVIGTITQTWQSDSSIYVLTTLSNGITFNLYKNDLAMSGTMTLVKTFGLPTGATTAKFNKDSGLLYHSFNNRAYNIYNLANDPELNTPDSRVMPGTAQLNPYYFITGGGITMAVVSSGTVGTAGASFKSVDGGVTWAAPTVIAGLNATSSISGMAYGNGTFVLITGATSTGNYSYTTTGTSWAGGMTSPATSRQGLIFDSVRGKFMAYPYATGGVILESTNGSTWVSAGTSPTNMLNMNFIQQATDGTIVIGLNGLTTSPLYFTTDGVSYTSYDHATDAETSGNSCVGLVGTKLIKFSSSNVVGSVTGMIRATSALTSAPSVWTAPVEFVRTPVTNFFAQCNGSSIVMMDGTSKDVTQFITQKWNGMVSTDRGATWTKFTLNTGADSVLWSGLTATTSGFMAVGKINAFGNTNNMVFATSTDGVTWNYVNTNGLPATTSQINSITCSTNGVILVSQGSGANAFRSTNNGQTWTSVALGTGTGAPVYIQAVGTGFAAVTNTINSITTTATKWSTDGITWTSPSVVPAIQSVPVMAASGMQGINNIVVFMIGRAGSTIKDFMYSLNGGQSWALATLPVTAASLAPVGIAMVNGVVVIPLANGYILRTTDITSSTLWETASVHTVAGDLTTYNFGQVVSSFDRTDIMMTAPNSLSENFIVRGVTENSDFRRVPNMPSDVPNTKWVIRAK